MFLVLKHVLSSVRSPSSMSSLLKIFFEGMKIVDKIKET